VKRGETGKKAGQQVKKVAALFAVMFLCYSMRARSPMVVSSFEVSENPRKCTMLWTSCCVGMV
jgi:hypothetical protein